jgi:hypothetical protein
VCRVVGESVVARQQPRRVFTGRPMAQSSLGRRTARQVGELARSLATIWASAVRASAPGLATQPTHVTARSALRRNSRLNRLRAYLYKP